MAASIRIGIIGVGNCASSLLRGIYGFDSDDCNLMHETLGGYRLSDLEAVCAFDVDERKVGAPLDEAVAHNTDYGDNAIGEDVGGLVYRGPTFDGVADHMADGDRDTFAVADHEPAVDVAEKLDEHDVDVAINYLPVGSAEAVDHYATACLETGTAFVNAMPVFVASDADWTARFERAGVPVVGDDIKSQVGATITHRALMEMLVERGVSVENTYQLNVGGNTDFKNMLDSDRLESKEVSKTNSVNAQLDEPLPDENIHIGPSDYVPWLGDNKVAFVRIEGELFGGAPFDIELRLSVEDSPNSAGAAVDAIRGAKVALDRGLGGPIDEVSAFTMKSPPTQMPDGEAAQAIREFATE